MVRGARTAQDTCRLCSAAVDIVSSYCVCVCLFVCVTSEREAERSLGMLGNVDPLSSEQVDKILVGRMKGIQGHCNSCYMDSALFRLG